ncbi:hypothetical protein JW921_01675 [Candidatus Fermentibacterales bacterium]|nr:hypothetical protein [Candidatus Fermentibacterales bacterium]
MKSGIMGKRCVAALALCLVLGLAGPATGTDPEDLSPTFIITVGEETWELSGRVVVAGGQTMIMGLPDGYGEEGPVTIVIQGDPSVGFTTTYGSSVSQIMIGGMLYVANRNTVEQGTELLVTFGELVNGWSGTFEGAAIYAEPGALGPSLIEFQGSFDIPQESVTQY